MAENQFEMIEELGRGGMGVVMKARDKTLGRIVALKLLPKQLSENPTLVKRFQREAMAAAGLNHPHIVTVYSIGEQDGSLFIAMEFVDGISLAELIIAEGKQEARQSVVYIKQSAEALAEAHAHKIVHRDIKPHNIMIDKSNRVKVADFGLARVVQADTELTADGTRLGTPRYMSPEQVEAKSLTPVSDIYSLGVVLYELLAARPAFHADTTLQVMRQIVDGAFPDVTKANSQVPPEVGRILAKMVAKAPQDRYPTAEAVVKDIDSWLTTGMAPRAAGATVGELSSATVGGPMPGAPAKKRPDKDFIIHFVDPDRTWAEWIQLQLIEVGYKAVLMEWDFEKSQESLRQVLKAIEQSTTILVVASPNYLLTLHGAPAWVEAYQKGQIRAVPMVVRPCTIGATFRTTSHIDMSKLSQEQARDALIQEARDLRGEAPEAEVEVDLEDLLAKAPSSQIQTALVLPYVANAQFTGRGDHLTNLYRNLNERGGIVVLTQENPDFSGFGRTQIAVEYAFLNRSHYAAIFWIRAHSRLTLMSDFAAIAERLGLPEQDAKQFSVAKKATKKWMKQNEGWLLIFDDAPSIKDISTFVMREPKGHVIITSPNPKWPKATNPMVIGPLERPESIDFLFKRTNQRNEGAAAALAAVLGDIPLALTLAGAYIDAAGTTLDQYIDLYLEQHKDMFGFHDPPKDSRAVTTTALMLSLDRVLLESRPAADLLKACAYFAPTNIRISRLSLGAKTFPKALAKTLSTAPKRNEAVATLKRFALVEERDDALWFHGLIQELVCEFLETKVGADGNKCLADFVGRLRYARFERKDTSAWAKPLLTFMTDSLPEDTYDSNNWSEYELFVDHARNVVQRNQRLENAPKEISELWRRLGGYSFERAEYQAATTAYQQAIEMHQKGYGQKHKGLARLYKELAHIHRAQSDLKKARVDYEAALSIEQATYGKTHKDIAATTSNLGNVLMELGEHALARQCYMRALEIDRKVHGARHEDVGRNLTYLGLVSQELGDLTAAWGYYQEALEIAESVYGSEHARVSAAVKNIAGLLQKMGDLVRAKEFYKRAIEIDTALNGEHHPEVAQDYNNMGLTMEALGFTKDALSNYKKALNIDQAVYGPNHPKVGINMNNVANILRGQGDLEGAEAYYKDAARIFKAALGANHKHTQTALRNLKKARAGRSQAKSGPKVAD